MNGDKGGTESPLVISRRPCMAKWVTSKIGLWGSRKTQDIFVFPHLPSYTQKVGFSSKPYDFWHSEVVKDKAMVKKMFCIISFLSHSLFVDRSAVLACEVLYDIFPVKQFSKFPASVTCCIVSKGVFWSHLLDSLSKHLALTIVVA